MSFKSIIAGIEKGLAVAGHVAIPLASTFFPQLAPELNIANNYLTKLNTIFQQVPNAIIAAEALTEKDGQGAVKEANVIAAFQQGLQGMQDGLALANKKLTYDEAELKNAIASFTAGYNSLAKVKASFKVVDL